MEIETSLSICLFILHYLTVTCSQAACRIQCLLRRQSATENYRAMRLKEAGRRLYAQRVILRAWLRVRDRKRFKALKEQWELEQSQAVLEDIRREGEETVVGGLRTHEISSTFDRLSYSMDK